MCSGETQRWVSCIQALRVLISVRACQQVLALGDACDLTRPVVVAELGQVAVGEQPSVCTIAPGGLWFAGGRPTENDDLAWPHRDGGKASQRRNS